MDEDLSKIGEKVIQVKMDIIIEETIEYDECTNAF